MFGFTLRALIMTSIGIIAINCGGNGSNDVKTAFGPPTKTSTFAYKVEIPKITSKTIFAGVLGEKLVKGANYLRHKGGYGITSAKDLSDSTQGAEFWFNRKDSNSVEGVGYEEVGVRTVTLDQPLTLNLNPPLNTQQTITASGTAQVPGGQPIAASGTATYTMVSDSETVDTGVGPISGCRHYSGSVRLSGAGTPPEFQDMDVAAEVWYHPDYGLVSGKVPQFNVNGSLEDVTDLGDTSSGSNTIKKVGVIGAGGKTEFLLSTFDVNGKNDATKFEHAKMLLELRWANDEDAKTMAAPGYPLVNISFNTVWGTFPFELIESPISIFHPDENGKGFRYWVGFVDQAAKNEPGADGISYNIRVTADPMIHSLRCTARIFYKLAPNP